MKLLKYKSNLMLLCLALLGVVALCLVGAWGNGSFPTMGMLLGCLVCSLSAYQVLCNYFYVQSQMRRRTIRKMQRVAQAQLQNSLQVVSTSKLYCEPKNVA